jgi:hypothetical protein
MALVVIATTVHQHLARRPSHTVFHMHLHRILQSPVQVQQHGAALTIATNQLQPSLVLLLLLMLHILLMVVEYVLELLQLLP